MLGDVRRFIAQTNRYTAGLRKLLSIKGEGHDVSFGVHLEEERPEYSFIKGERRWAQFNQATSAAGTLPAVGVRNPAGSGLLSVVTSVFMYSSAANGVFNLETFVGGTGLGGGIVPMFSTDLRWGNVSMTTTLANGVATGVYSGHIVAQVVSPGGNVIIDLVSPSGRVPPIILAPNSELAVVGNAVGVDTLSVIICGYERPLESGEQIPG